MATTIERGTKEGGQQAPPEPRRKGWALWILSGAALVAVAVAAATFFWPSSGGPQQTPAARAVNSLYTQNEQKVMQLVNEGRVPAETLQGGIYRIKALVNQGLIPAATLQQYVAPVPPLYTKQELKIMALVAQGVLPRETLNAEPFRTKRLINQGLIPRAAANPASSGGR